MRSVQSGQSNNHQARGAIIALQVPLRFIVWLNQIREKSGGNEAGGGVT